MAIRNLDITKQYIQGLRDKGLNSGQIVDSLSRQRASFDVRLPDKIRQLRSQGVADDQIVSNLETLQDNDRVPLITEEDLETKGLLGGVADFIGSEKLGRRIGTTLAQLDPRHRQNIRSVEQTGGKEQADLLRTGGVSGAQALGGAALTAANVALPGLGGAVSRGTSLAGKAGRLAAGGAAFGALGGLEESGTLGGAVAGAGAGALLGPAVGGAAAGTIGLSRWLLGSLPKKVAGFAVGKSPKLLDEIIQNPRVALKTLDDSEGVVRELVENMRSTTKDISKKMGNNFKSEKSNLFNRIGANKINRDVVGIQDDVKQILNDFDVIVGSDGVLNFERAGLSKAEQTKIKDSWKLIQNLDDNSIARIDDLKSSVNKFKKFDAPQGTKGSATVSSIASKLDDYLTNPQFGGSDRLKALNANFSKRRAFVNDLQKLLKINKSGILADEQAFRKMANLFSKNQDEARRLITSIGFDDQDLLGLSDDFIRLQQEGQEAVASIATREFADVGRLDFKNVDIIRGIIGLILSPELVAKTAAKTSVAKQATRDFVSKVIKQLPAEAIEDISKSPEKYGIKASDLKEINRVVKDLTGANFTKELVQASE